MSKRFPPDHGARPKRALQLAHFVALFVAPVFGFATGSSFAGATAAPGNVMPAQSDRCDAPDPLTTDKFLSDNWLGARTWLHQRGVDIDSSYQGEVFTNFGGANHSTIFDGMFNLGLTFDLCRLTGFWEGATLHANALYIYGPSLSQDYIGDFSDTSNIAGHNGVRLQELWLQQKFWNGQASIRLGLLAADMEFFSSDASSLFLNGTFGAFNILAENFSNAPFYPVANPGVRVDYQPSPKFDFKASVSSDNEISDPMTTNQHGVFFDIKSRDGILFALEGSYLVNQAPGDDGPVASYRLGSYIQRGDYTTFLSQATSEIGVGNLSHRGTNYAFYGVVDREIYKKDGRVVTAFTRGGFAPKRYSFVDGYFDAGFNWQGIFQKDDVVGFGIAYSAVSGEFSNASLLRGGPVFTSETVLEASYRFSIKPWWKIQPDLQYIFTPGGAEGARDAFVFGIRTTVTF